MKMKRGIVGILVTVMVLSCCLVGCGQETQLGDKKQS
jgi:hypothetical protein